MTKAELLKALEALPDDTEIYIVDYDGYFDNSDEWRLSHILAVDKDTDNPIVYLFI